MPLMDDTQTMAPPACSALAASSASLMRNCAVRLMSSTLRHAGSVMRAMVLSRVMPALCTRMSMPPSAANCCASTAGVSGAAMS